MLAARLLLISLKRCACGHEFVQSHLQHCMLTMMGQKHVILQCLHESVEGISVACKTDETTEQLVMNSYAVKLCLNIPGAIAALAAGPTRTLMASSSACTFK